MLNSKYSIFFFAMLFICVGLSAQVQEWQWASIVGGNIGGYGQAIAVDSQGNGYVTGIFYSTASFGTTTLDCSGYSDIFVAKVDSSGNWLWAKRAGCPINDGVLGMEFGYDIAVDSNANVYITGSFCGTADFGTLSLTSSGYSDIFVAKLDSNGNWIWAKRAGGTGWDYCYGIALDSAANVCITGNFEGTVDLGNISLISSGDFDIFIAKLNNNGSWIWAKRAGGAGFDKSCSITVDNMANVYMTGIFYQTADFGNTTFSNSFNSTVFVSKLDSNGNWLWAIHPDGNFNIWGIDITINSANDIYLCGTYTTTTNFGNTTLLSSPSWQNGFIAKLANDGNWIWAKKVGGGKVHCWSAAADSDGNVYLTGDFWTCDDFGQTHLSGFNGEIIFVTKLDCNGNWLWAKQAGGLRDTFGYGIAVDSADQVYLTGRYWGNVSIGATNITDDQERNIYVAKIGTEVGQLCGHVSTVFEQSIVGAVIHVGSISTTSDINGDFLLYLPGGTFSVTCTTPDHTVQIIDNIVITVGQTTFHDFWIAVSNEDNLIINTGNVISNHPNPFSTSTDIRYNVKKTSPVRIDIFNCKGQLIRTLVNEVKASGQHNVIWNCTGESGNPLASGVYYYRMKTGTYQTTHCMLLIR